MDKEFASDLEFGSVYLPGEKAIGQMINIYRSKLVNDEEIWKLGIHYGPRMTLDELYVQHIMQEGRGNQATNANMGRHEIYHTYLKPPDYSILIDSIEDLFSCKVNDDAQPPCRIRIVGRPGIGKS